MSTQIPRVIQKNQIFREKLAAGKALSGAWATLGSPEITYMMARSGLDYIIVDLEHGRGGIEGAAAQIQATLSLDTAIIVRLLDHSAGSIKRLLDSGANALLAPMVDTVEQARALCDAAYYAPTGRRGNAVGAVPASDFGYLPMPYFQAANETITLIAQIETREGIANLDALLQVPHIHGFFVGPFDLSGSLGKFRVFDDPEFLAAVEQIQTKVLAADKLLGCLPYVGVTAVELFARGVQIAPQGADQVWVRNGAMQIVESMANVPNRA